MKSLIFSLNLIACLFLAACANQESRSSEEKIASALDDMALQTSDRPVRIRDYKVQSWRYIDNSNLIIEAGRREHYLISLAIPCHQLTGAFSIGFTTTAGSLDKFEDILVSGNRGGPERCPIADIVKLLPIPRDNVDPLPE